MNLTILESRIPSLQVRSLNCHYRKARAMRRRFQQSASLPSGGPAQATVTGNAGT
jgi:hypothetical protein